MTTFTKGQKIRRTRGVSMYLYIGEEATVASVNRDEPGDSWITLEGYGDKEFLAEYFEPVEDTPAPLKPGQVWAATADPEETYHVIEVRDGDVWSENRYGSHVVISASLFPNGRQLVTDATPAPIDPAKVKAGDTVKLTSPASVNKGTVKVPARIEGVVREVLPDGRIAVHGVQGFFFPSTLTAHQSAPEPKPEESDFHRGFRLGYDNGYTNGRIQASADDSGETSEDTPEPLDPAKVRVGATVTVTVDDDSIGSYEVKGEVRGHLGGTWSVGPINVASSGTWHEGVTLTAHQPAPEPEPEWRVGAMYRATVHGDRDVEVMFTRGPSTKTEGPDGYYPWYVPSQDDFYHEVTDVRPLVVLDPAKVDVDALTEVLMRAWRTCPWGENAHARQAREALAHLGIEAS